MRQPIGAARAANRFDAARSETQTVVRRNHSDQARRAEDALADSPSSEQLSSLFGLLKELACSNLESLRLAKELMVAQELADECEARAVSAAPMAAACGAEAQAIKRAAAEAAAIERLNEEELRLSQAWALHRREVHRLVAAADELDLRYRATALRRVER